MLYLLYCTVLYCTVLYCTLLYCNLLYCTVLYCTVLYYTVMYYTVLCCTVPISYQNIIRNSPLSQLKMIIFQSLEHKYHNQSRSDKAFKGTVVNRTCYSRESLKISCTVSLNVIVPVSVNAGDNKKYSRPLRST